jgi:chorismate synthase
VTILAWVSAIGGDAIDMANFDPAQIGQNPFFCPDAQAAARWEGLVDQARKAGSSLGAVVECVATGVPAGWGAPLYAKLDAELAHAMMGINAVKGVEIGDGFAAAANTGEGNADPMRPADDGRNAGPQFLANHAACIAGAFPPASRSPCGWRSSPRPRSSPRCPRSPARAKATEFHPRPPRPLLWGFAGCRWWKR